MSLRGVISHLPPHGVFLVLSLCSYGKVARTRIPTSSFLKSLLFFDLATIKMEHTTLKLSKCNFPDDYYYFEFKPQQSQLKKKVICATHVGNAFDPNEGPPFKTLNFPPFHTMNPNSQKYCSKHMPAALLVQIPPHCLQHSKKLPLTPLSHLWPFARKKTLRQRPQQPSSQPGT